MIPSIVLYCLLVFVVTLLVVASFTRDYYRNKYQRSEGKDFVSHQRYLKIQDWFTIGFWSMLVVIVLFVIALGYDVYVGRLTT